MVVAQKITALLEAMEQQPGRSTISIIFNNIIYLYLMIHITINHMEVVTLARTTFSNSIYALRFHYQQKRSVSVG